MAMLLLFVVFQCLLLLFVFESYAAVNYDGSFINECLEDPRTTLNRGGIVVNPNFDQALEQKGFYWKPLGNAKLNRMTSDKGNNNYVVAYNRKQPDDSIQQTLYLTAGYQYTVSAWLQVSDEEASRVSVVFMTNTRNITAASGEAVSGCWSMVKGGFSVPTSGNATLYFQTNSTCNISVDSVSVQPHNEEEWKFHQQLNIEKYRESKVKIQALNDNGSPLANVTVSLTQTRAHFQFGCAINANILQNTKYQKWFLDRFTNRVTVFENELKWYSTERTRGNVDYSTADAMVNFSKSNGISIRGHNALWDDPNYQPYWVKGLPRNELLKAARKRVKSVMHRYKGKLFQWDVVNENLHFSFFEDRLKNASTKFYKLAHRVDKLTTPFLNDFNTIEDCSDRNATPGVYLNKIKTMREGGYHGPLGIGLEGHFPYKKPNLAYIKSVLDQFHHANHKVWITELDVHKGKHRSEYLRKILAELYSHPAVEGILIWSAWSKNGKCYRMCLTDDNFNNLDTGDVVDDFLSGLKCNSKRSRVTDADGFYEGSLAHGEYDVEMRADGRLVSETRRISVVPNKEGTTTKTRIHRFTINVEN